MFGDAASGGNVNPGSPECAQYPSNHMPPAPSIEIDRVARRAIVGGRQIEPAELATLADASLTWDQAAPRRRLPG